MPYFVNKKYLHERSTRAPGLAARNLAGTETAGLLSAYKHVRNEYTPPQHHVSEVHENTVSSATVPAAAMHFPAALQTVLGMAKHKSACVVYE